MREQEFDYLHTEAFSWCDEQLEIKRIEQEEEKEIERHNILMITGIVISIALLVIGLIYCDAHGIIID